MYRMFPKNNNCNCKLLLTNLKYIFQCFKCIERLLKKKFPFLTAKYTECTI